MGQYTRPPKVVREWLDAGPQEWRELAMLAKREACGLAETVAQAQARGYRVELGEELPGKMAVGAFRIGGQQVIVVDRRAGPEWQAAFVTVMCWLLAGVR